MGLYLNPGTEEFRNAAIHSKIYVDKTEMIKFTNSQYAGGILQQRLRFEGIV